MTKKTALFFGSFNPVHVGHLIIADFIQGLDDIGEVWMVISPHNPFKEKKSLAKDYDRLEMMHLAIGDNPKIRASDIEFSLPKPSYTVDTLAYLKEKYPHREFALVMGGDNLQSFHRWKNYETILRDHEIYVYARPGYETDKYQDEEGVHILEAPLLSISASYIRRRIKDGESIRYLVREPVREFIMSKRLYQDMA